VADGRVAFVCDGDDDEDGGAKNDVGGRIDEKGKGPAVPVEVEVESANDAVVEGGEQDQERVDDGEHDL